MPIIQVAPPIVVEPPQPPVELPVPGLRMSWTGWDGSEWDLSDPAGGVYLAPGVRGLTMPQVSHWRSQSPMVAGSRWRGYRSHHRDVFWPLWVFSSAKYQTWVELDGAFWRTLHPDRLGTWTVTKPSGERRSLRLRFESDDFAAPFDPAMVGWAKYGIGLVAEAPLWAGTSIVREFLSAASVPFFGGPGVINISSGSTMASASIPNPGDVDAWVTWTLFGPFTAATVGVAGATISVPLSVADGASVTVFTQPDLMQAVHSTTGDVTDQLGAASFAPVAPGASVPLSVAMTGAGSVQADLVPSYYRAW